MQIIYKFRVHFEEHDDVVRFIDIDSTSSFAVFHKIIQESIGFDASKAYTFHLSNDFWRTDAQICDSDPREESTVKLPKATILNKFINDPHQRFIYMFDPELIWTFYIELVKIQKAEPHKKYPLIARKEGEAPKQNKIIGKLPGATANVNEFDKMADMLIASRMLDEMNPKEDEDEIDEIENLDTHELAIDIPELIIPEFPITAALSIPKVPIAANLKFDEEELTIDADDFDFLESEEGEDEKNQGLDDDDDIEIDEEDEYGSKSDYDTNDDY